MRGGGGKKNQNNGICDLTNENQRMTQEKASNLISSSPANIKNCCECQHCICCQSLLNVQASISAHSFGTGAVSVGIE